MSKKDTEIRCLARLDELSATNSLIMDFLVQEDLMTREQRKAITASADVAKALQGHIAALKGNKLQLLEYEWTLLPEERIKVILISDRATKEFTWNY